MTCKNKMRKLSLKSGQIYSLFMFVFFFAPNRKRAEFDMPYLSICIARTCSTICVT